MNPTPARSVNLFVLSFSDETGDVVVGVIEDENSMALLLSEHLMRRFIKSLPEKPTGSLMTAEQISAYRVYVRKHAMEYKVERLA